MRHKKAIYVLIQLILCQTIFLAQNAIVGDGFSTGWGGGSCPTGNTNFTYFSSSFGSSFGATLSSSSTGDRYFRFGIDWSGTFAQRTITIGSDVEVFSGIEDSLSNTCTTSGAMKINVGSISNRYVFKTQEGGTNPKGKFIVFEVLGDVRTITGVSQTPLSNAVTSTDSPIITINTNDALNAGQAVFIRYTTDNWFTSSVVAATGSGTQYSASIPAQTAGAVVKYYALTSGSNVTPTHANADFYTINANTNSGNNYTYTVLIPNKVTVSPTNPNDEVPVTITYNAAGSALAGATKVYLHAGVSSVSASTTTFSHTRGNWGQDDGVGLMTSTGTDTWTITLTPNLRSYFSVPSENDIFGLNFLFRSANGQLKDDNSGANFSYLTDPLPIITLTSPTSSSTFLPIGSPLSFNASFSPSANSWSLVEVDPANNTTIATLASMASTAANAAYSISNTSTTQRKFVITANFPNGKTKSKSFTLTGFNAVSNLPRPSWAKLGINYHVGDPTKATLVLHAPTYTRLKKGSGSQYGSKNTPAKSVVYVVGDFNNWTPSESYKLNRDRDGWDDNVDTDGDGDRGDYWWITLENLVPGQEYVFQYLVDGSIRVADPYTHKVSDPDDHQISSATYPNLISYRPQAQDRASILQTNRSTFNWTAPSFAKPTTNKLNIYELHFRDFTDEGTYLAAISKLDYIKNLGINAIHVMPVSEFEGNSSWGYNPNFYFAADKAYGTEDDLKLFIDECHKRQIQVFNDLVLNHAFYSNVMAKLYWNAAENKPAEDNPWFNANHKMVRNQAGWWGADWNHESEHVQAMVDSALGYWLKEFKFDGFRFDFTKGFGQTDPNAFPAGDDWASTRDLDRIELLKRMADRMWSRYPGSVIIFEHLANSEEDKVLADHGILMWSGVGHHNDLKAFILGWPDANTNIYDSGVYNASGRNFSLANWMSYGESHDEERLGYELLQYYNGTKNTANMIDRLKLAYGFNLLLPGPRMIWQFGELGYDVSINFNGRTGEKPVRWDYYDDVKRKELYKLVAKVLKIRNTQNIYATTPDYGNIGLGGGNIATPRIMKFATNDGKHVIIVGNLDPTNARNVTPSFPTQGNWYRYNGVLDGSVYAVNATNQNTNYTLNPSEVIIFTNFDVDECTKVTNNNDNGVYSLRHAIGCAQSHETISVNLPTTNASILLNNAIQINKTVTLDFSQMQETILKSSGLIEDHLFNIAPNVSMTIINGKIDVGNKKAFIVDGNLTINNTEIKKAATNTQPIIQINSNASMTIVGNNQIKSY